MEIGDEILAMRSTERYGGQEVVGSTLWLEHAEGIKFKAEESILCF